MRQVYPKGLGQTSSFLHEVFFVSPPHQHDIHEHHYTRALATAWRMAIERPRSTKSSHDDTRESGARVSRALLSRSRVASHPDVYTQLLRCESSRSHPHRHAAASPPPARFASPASSHKSVTHALGRRSHDAPRGPFQPAATPPPVCAVPRNRPRYGPNIGRLALSLLTKCSLDGGGVSPRADNK